jgi:hypothetical protein
VTSAQVARDRARGVSANLEDATAPARFANPSPQAFVMPEALDPLPLLRALYELEIECIVVGGFARLHPGDEGSGHRPKPSR